MELLFKGVALALSAAVLGLVIRQKNPEFSLLIGLITVVTLLLAAVSFARSVSSLVDLVRSQLGQAETVTGPILKCLAVSLVTKFSGDLCRDASQTGAAAAVDVLGTLCAIGIAVPVLVSMIRMVEGYL